MTAARRTAHELSAAPQNAVAVAAYSRAVTVTASCAVQAATNVDQRFLTYLSDLLLCSRCLHSGIRTPVRQVISPRHRPQSLCRDCRGADARAGH